MLLSWLKCRSKNGIKCLARVRVYTCVHACTCVCVCKQTLDLTIHQKLRSLITNKMPLAISLMDSYKSQSTDHLRTLHTCTYITYMHMQYRMHSHVYRRKWISIGNFYTKIIYGWCKIASMIFHHKHEIFNMFRVQKFQMCEYLF